MSLIFKSYGIGCQPSPSVPAETIMADAFSTYLLFFAVSESVGESGFLADMGVAIVECVGCVISSFGYPNDEGFPEHPLYECGLCDVHSPVAEVVGSAWLEAVSSQLVASSQRICGQRGMNQGIKQKSSRRHFIVPFKEKTFECIANEIVVVRYAKNLKEATDYVLSKFAEH